MLSVFESQSDRSNRVPGEMGYHQGHAYMGGESVKWETKEKGIVNFSIVGPFWGAGQLAIKERTTMRTGYHGKSRSKA